MKLSKEMLSEDKIYILIYFEYNQENNIGYLKSDLYLTVS